MTGVLADLAVDLLWHGWQASIVGVIALGLAAATRQRAPRLAALILALALLKFLVPPIVRVPIAFGDFAATLVNPLALVPSGQEAGGIAAVLLAALGVMLITTALAVAARVGAHVAAVARLRRGAAPARGRARAAMARVSSTLRLRIEPELLISPHAEGPFATGVWRPAIILPRGLARDLDDAALDAVIAHELLHHRRRDLPMAWCAAAATTVFWFSPVAWRLARRLAELREECCDADVTRLGLATPRQYVDALLSAAAVPSGHAALAMHGGHPLGRRVRRLLDPPAPLPRVVAGLILVVFAVLCLPATPFASPWRADDGVVRVIRIVR